MQKLRFLTQVLKEDDSENAYIFMYKCLNFEKTL